MLANTEECLFCQGFMLLDRIFSVIKYPCLAFLTLFMFVVFCTQAFSFKECF